MASLEPNWCLSFSTVCVGSVTAPDFAERFVKTAFDVYKGLDIIIDNAGYTWDPLI